MTHHRLSLARLVLVFAIGSPTAVSSQPASAPAGPGTDASPVVVVSAGRLAGSREGELSVFKGIPYATAPLGALRWREPQGLPAWQGTRSAQSFGRACIQKPGLSAANGGDPGPLGEDCLFLNVWAPRAATPGGLPVLVWIHGGALVFGAGSVPAYDGSALAQRGAVVVSINYRLGALGFFAHPALGNTVPGKAVNFGLLDQVAALRWVRQNIAAFGGDPTRVTIFGQSAGAQSVLALYASPLASGLFARGIAQSAYGVPSHSLAKAQATGAKVAEALGLPGKDASAEALRAVPAAAFGQLDGAGLSLAPAFVVGDAALPKTILATFQEGREAAVPLIIGNTSDDSSVAVAFGIDPAALVKRIGAARIAVKPLYPKVTSDAELGRQVVRDLLFTTFSRRIAWLHSARAPTWRYYFDYVPAGLRSTQPGTPHGGEIVYAMGTADSCACSGVPVSAEDREVARRTVDYWSAFAAGGVPRAAGQPDWPRDTRSTSETMAFGSGAEVRTDFMKARLNAFTVMLKVLDRLAPAR